MPLTSGRAGYIALRAPQQACTHLNHSLGDQDGVGSHPSLSKTTNWKPHHAVILLYTATRAPRNLRGRKRFTAQTLRCGTRWLDFQGFLLSTFSIDTHLVSLTGSDATKTSRHFSALVMNMVVFRHTSDATLWSLHKDSSPAWTTSLEPAMH